MPSHRHDIRRITRGSALPADDGTRRAPATPRLTPRETMVLSLLAQGLTARMIARRLGVATSTVSKHQENLYRKFGTGDRLTTVLAAQRLRLIP
jgi:DNA-binding NarL/FixJ family response regulator